MLKSNERQLALIKDPANQPSKTDGEIEDSPTREKNNSVLYNNESVSF